MKKLFEDALSFTSPSKSNANAHSNTNTPHSKVSPRGVITPTPVVQFSHIEKTDSSHRSISKTLTDLQFLTQVAINQSPKHINILEEFFYVPTTLQSAIIPKKNQFLSTTGIPLLGIEEFYQLFFGYNEATNREYPVTKNEDNSAGGDWHPGLLSLGYYPSTQDKKIIHLIEEITEILLCKGYLSSIISFRNIQTIEEARCSLLSSEVVKIVTGEKGLLDIISFGNTHSLLLLYYFLSVDYEGAASIWKALALLPDSEIRELCKTLVHQFLSPTLQKIVNEKTGFQIFKQKEDNSTYYAYTLLKRLMEWKGWKKSGNISNNNNNSSSSGNSNNNSPVKPSKEEETLHQCIESFSSHFTCHLSPALFVPSKVNEKEEVGNVSSAQSGLIQQTQLLAERLSKLEQSLTSMQNRNEILESELKYSKQNSFSGEDPSARSKQKSTHKKKKEFHLFTKSSHTETSLQKLQNLPLHIGDVGFGQDWSGISHVDCTTKKDYALLQKNDGKYTMINKAPGDGYIALSVGHDPKVIMDENGNLGVGVLDPKAKLHVEGPIRCGSTSFGVLSPENLSVIRGGFSCRTLEPRSNPGYVVEAFDNGVFEIRFTEPFAKRPSVFALMYTPQAPPSLIAIGYADNTKFGFYEVSGKVEVWVEFYVFGPKCTASDVVVPT